MRNSLLIFTLSLLLVVAVGCKKPPLPVPDEIDNSGGTGEVEKSQFAGTWDYTAIVFKNGTLSFQGNDVGTFVGEGEDIDGTVTFTEDPNEWTSNLVFTASIDATFFGQTQNQKLPIDKTVITGTWTEANGEISLMDDTGKTISVISSSANKIVFTDNFTERITIGQGFGVDANSDVEFTLTK